MNDTMESIKEIIDSFDKGIANVGEGDDLQELGFDSIDFIQLVVKIEQKFQIFIKDEDLLFENFSTMSKIMDYVEQEA